MAARKTPAWSRLSSIASRHERRHAGLQPLRALAARHVSAPFRLAHGAVRHHAGPGLFLYGQHTGRTARRAAVCRHARRRHHQADGRSGQRQDHAVPYAGRAPAAPGRRAVFAQSPPGAGRSPARHRRRTGPGTGRLPRRCRAARPAWRADRPACGGAPGGAAGRRSASHAGRHPGSAAPADEPGNGQPQAAADRPVWPAGIAAHAGLAPVPPIEGAHHPQFHRAAPAASLAERLSDMPPERRRPHGAARVYTGRAAPPGARGARHRTQGQYPVRQGLAGRVCGRCAANQRAPHAPGHCRQPISPAALACGQAGGGRLERADAAAGRRAAVAMAGAGDDSGDPGPGRGPARAVARAVDAARQQAGRIARLAGTARAAATGAAHRQLAR
ncbi:hypothetical protein D3C72_1270360 [compost metagenome]